MLSAGFCACLWRSRGGLDPYVGEGYVCAHTGAVIVHEALTNLLQPDPAPNRSGALVSALEAATTLRDDATLAAADGASAMNSAFVAGHSKAEPPLTDEEELLTPPSGPSTWRQASGRTNGQASYQFGDATRSALGWARSKLST